MAASYNLAVIQLGQNGDGTMLNVHNGRVSLLAAYEGRGGRNYFRTAYPKLKHGPAEKDIPLGANLGTVDQATRALEQFLTALKKYQARDPR